MTRIPSAYFSGDRLGKGRLFPNIVLWMAPMIREIPYVVDPYRSDPLSRHDEEDWPGKSGVAGISGSPARRPTRYVANAVRNRVSEPRPVSRFDRVSRGSFRFKGLPVAGELVLDHRIRSQRRSVPRRNSPGKGLVASPWRSIERSRFSIGWGFRSLPCSVIRGKNRCLLQDDSWRSRTETGLQRL